MRISRDTPGLLKPKHFCPFPASSGGGHVRAQQDLACEIAGLDISAPMLPCRDSTPTGSSSQGPARSSGENKVPPMLPELSALIPARRHWHICYPWQQWVELILDWLHAGEWGLPCPVTDFQAQRVILFWTLTNFQCLGSDLLKKQNHTSTCATCKQQRLKTQPHAICRTLLEFASSTACGTCLSFQPHCKSLLLPELLIQGRPLLHF